MSENTFLTDVQTLRERAAKSLEDGALVPTYKGDADKTIEILQMVLATEVVCSLRYKMNEIAAEGLYYKEVAAEFAEHSSEEWGHAMQVAERIDQLGGVPDMNPAHFTGRSATEYGKDGTLIEMIKGNLVAERVVVEHYQELIRYFGDDDITTRVMLEGILADEEEHAADLHDFLVAHQGKPFLD